MTGDAIIAHAARAVAGQGGPDRDLAVARRLGIFLDSLHLPCDIDGASLAAQERLREIACFEGAARLLVSIVDVPGGDADSLRSDDLSRVIADGLTAHLFDGEP